MGRVVGPLKPCPVEPIDSDDVRMVVLERSLAPQAVAVEAVVGIGRYSHEETRS